MKKLFSLIIVSLFVMASLAMADSSWDYENVVILGPRRGSVGITPPVEVIKVSTGSDDSAEVGDVMVWDLAPSDGSGLGYVVANCDRDAASGDIGGDRGKGPFAGVMITITSQETEWTTARGSDETVGYMAIRGFCDAKVDPGQASLGYPLAVTAEGQFITIDQTKTNGAGAVTQDNTRCNDASEDIGYLMEYSSTAQLMKVWLR